MKAKTSDSNKNCFTFPNGYSLSLANTCTINFLPTTGFNVYEGNGVGINLALSVP
jgi:hypothetical protein